MKTKDFELTPHKIKGSGFFNLSTLSTKLKILFASKVKFFYTFATFANKIGKNLKQDRIPKSAKRRYTNKTHLIRTEVSLDGAERKK